MKNLFVLKSPELTVTIKDIGAELCSIIDNKNGYEFMWDANPDIWNRHAPVLFPIVGKLNNNSIEINGQKHSMNQHGFARDMVFEPIEVYDNVLRFMLESDSVSLEKYPYQFRFFIEYSISGNRIKVSYSIINMDHKTAYFSVGAHPGFKLPIDDLSLYEIEFEKKENLCRYLIKDGLQTGETESLGVDSNRINLHSDQFLKDAIIFKHLKSNWIRLRQKNSNYEIKMSVNEFPFLGIWTKQGCEKFICLEPWQGITDSAGITSEIEKKEGIVPILPHETKHYSYTIEFISG